MVAVRLLYYLVTIVCLCMSAYLSYFGYLFHTGQITLFFVAMIIATMLACDIAIQVRREGAERIGGILLFMMIPISLSSMSNFNHLYTLFLEDDVTKKTLTQQYDVFSNDLVNTRATLNNLDVLQTTVQRRSQIDTQLELMWQQMSDPGRPGCASRCRAHMDNIQGILGVKLTELKIPGVGEPEAAQLAFFNNYSELVQDTRQNIESTEPTFAVHALLGDVAGYLEKYNSAENDIQNNIGLEQLQGLSEASLEVERRANALLPLRDHVRHRRIDPNEGRLGRIPNTIRNAFFDMPDPVATVLSAFFAILIDIFPVLLVLSLLRPGEGVAKGKDEGSLGPIL
ncbi:MAG: hypothetical protein ACPGGK_03475 [Pikeienuella sp.]